MCKPNEMAVHNQIGAEGETLARQYLVQQGYAILHTNWHWHHYELDIVAARADELVVVEVKTRSENYWAEPETAVDRGKIKRIVAAADAYARLFNIGWSVRFDLVLLIKEKEGYRLEHIEDAFYAPLR